MAKKRLAEELSQNSFVRLTPCRLRAIPIEGRTGLRQHPIIEQGIARPGVEGQHRVTVCGLARPDPRDVGEPADVEHAERAFKIAGARPMIEGREGSALPARGDISAAKVVDDIDADTPG